MFNIKIFNFSNLLKFVLSLFLFASNFNLSKAYADEAINKNLQLNSNSCENCNLSENYKILSPSIEDKMIRRHQVVYTEPYSFWNNNVDYKLVKAQTWTVLGASVAGLGFLYLMPESFTNWNKDDASDIFSKWWKNVKEGPVMDDDDFFLNYVTHPYWGAVYYMSARSSGASAPYSFLYSVLISTCFWEYGIEAFAEVPSKQDLVITPVVGSLIGEGFYLTKRHILSNDYELLNSKILGHATIFVMDPLTEVASWFIEEKELKDKDVSLYSFPGMTKSGNISYNMMVSVKF